VRVFSRATLQAFWNAHPDVEGPLRAWFDEVEKANWAGPQDIRARYRSADFVANDRVIFNIRGNNYRLIVHVSYRFHAVYIRFIGTNVVYDKSTLRRSSQPQGDAMNIRPIKTAEDHAWGLREIEKGMSDGTQPGTPEGDRLEVIMTLVEAYERQHHAIAPADPIEAIKFRMEQGKLSTTDLLSIFGTRGRASEILQRKRRMSLAMIRGLHSTLGISLDILVREYKLGRQRRPAARVAPARVKVRTKSGARA